MATQNINIGVNVSDNGTAKKTVKNFQEIEAAANKAQKAVEKVLSPGAGGTPGSRAVYSKAAPTGSQAMMSGEQYGSARGSAGLTGASARDFANQAQGLGGLVRLYATLAANVFAASAAYTALSNAMDTTNLIRGLNMLGAVSGQNLGTLSKRLVEVTDGAVSMREAMTAVAQSSSAGMSSKNIERLAQVAKNASLALGVAMPDALNRLSRGIVKLEPELLDELGLFTKIGPATERYALEIGKSASALTDFERRQAFANAVLEEGEKKFGALSQAAANPYDKLLATLKNVLQSGGEIINKVLAPIVSLLAESPSALAAVITGLSVVLLKQALPAIGQMRAGLRNTAEEALQTAEAFKESFGDEFQLRLEQRFKLPSLEADVKKAEAELAKLKFPGKMPASVTSLTDEKGELNVKKINSLLETRNKTVETGMRGSKKASETQIANAKQEILYIEKAIDLYRKKEALALGEEGALAVADIKPGRFDSETIAVRKYQDLLGKVDRSNAISNAAQNAQIAGVRGSWALLNAEVSEKGIKGFAKYSTLAQGGLAAIGTRVMGVVGSLSRVGEVVALAVAGFMLLDSWLTKNAKQTENFNRALVSADESVKSVTRTLSAATSLEGFATRSIENTTAFSTALNELTSSASEVIKLAREADRAAGTWDNFWDSVFSVFDKDRASKLAKTVAEQIKASIKLLQREGLADQYTAEIKKILNVDSLEDTKKVSEAFKNLSKTQQDALISIQNNANRALGNASSALQTFKASTDEALTASRSLANSFIDSSPLFKYGQSLISVSQSLTSIIAAGPDRVVQALQEVATNTEKMGLFGKTFVQSFAGISTLFLQQAKNIEASRNALIDYQNTLVKTNKLAQTGFEETGGGAAVGAPNIRVQRAAREQASIASSDLREIQRSINAQSDGVVKQAIALAKEGAKAIYAEGLAYINKAIREAQNAAATTIGRALTVNLTGVQKIEADNQLRQKELQYQLAGIAVSEQVLDTQASLVNEMRLANALQAEANTLLKNRGKEEKEFLDQNAAATREVALARGRLGDTSGLSAADKALIDAEKQTSQDLRRKGTQGQRIAIRSQMTASNISLQAQRPGAEIADSEEVLKIEDKKNASLLARTQILNNIAGITNVELVKAKQVSDTLQLQDKQKRELAELDSRIKTATDLKLTAEKQNTAQGSIVAKQQSEQIKKLQAIREATVGAQKADLSLAAAKDRQELLSEEISAIGRRTELEKSGAALKNTLAATALDTQSQELALYSSAYNLSREFVVSQQADLDIKKAQLETSSAIGQAESELAQKREEAQARKNALGEGEESQAKAINEELARQEAITNNTIAGLQAQGAAKTDILNKTKEINLEQERYNQLINSASDFSNTLKMGFEGAAESSQKIAAALGDVATTMAEVAINAEQRAKSEKAAQASVDAAWKTMDYDAVSKAEKEQADLKKKNAKQELADDIKTVNSTKKLFKEKTAAYKILNGIEKVMHITKLAMDAKELAVKLGSLATGTAAKAGAEAADTSLTFAGTIGRLPAYAAEIYGKTIGQLGPIAGPAVATALVAAMFAMFGKGGSKGGGFVPTAEQRQETQGTAMAYNSEGAKVQVRRGVFGDTDAKSESIANSLELIRETSVDGLSYDNKMVTLLQSIDSGINKTAKSLYSVQGLRSGSMFGTVTGTQSGGGLLGTGFLGSKTSRNITDSGLIIEGTFAQLASDTNKAVIDFFEQVTVSKKSWYGKTKTWVEERRSEIDDATSNFFKDIFGNATELFIEVGSKAGIDASAVKAVLNNLDVGKQFASLRGLKGEDFEKELSAIIGTVLDDAALAIFSSFTEFEQFGEGMLETVTRVIDSNTKVNQALKNLGVGFEAQLQSAGVLVERSITKQVTSMFGVVNKTITETVLETSFDPKDIQMESYRITESLVELAGGLEEFLDKTQFFAENFLTDAERLAPIQAAVTTEMARLGFATVDTREEFKQLVQAQDLTTESGRQNYTALMNVAEGFDQVTDAAEEAAERLKSAGENIRDALLELTGTAADLLAASRAKTLAETPDELKALQRYVFALEDVKTAEANLTKAREAEVNKLKQQKSTTESTINSLNNYINSIKKFRESLLLSAQSPLTPAERYTESKRQFDAILATAMGTATTPEEQRTKDLALGQLEGAATAFLDASRVYNASSAQYTSDFSLVQRALSDTESALTVQLSTEEKSLAELEKQTGLLEDQITASKGIETGLLSVADALSQLAAAQATVETAAQNTGVSQSIEGFYQQYLGRSAEPQGMQDWTNRVLGGQKTLAEVEQGIAQSPEAMEYSANKLAAATTAATTSIEGFYQQYLNRASDAPGLKFWVERVMSGTKTLAEVEQGIAQSPEAKVGLLYRELLGRQGDREGISFWTNALLSGVSKEDLIKSMLSSAMSIEPSSLTQLGRDIYSGAVAAAVPGFARGTNFVPEDMLAQIHQGERIVPAADNLELMQSIGNRNRTNEVLAQEIKKLNQEIKVLQKAVVDGAVINAQATDRNTVEISKTVKDTGLTASHAEAIRRRTQIV